ncbi:hypothetical protein CRYUN_Cryun34aG0029400 [Craigia yunnanensis]
MRNGHTDGAYLNWRSPTRLMPECQGSALPPVFVGAPLEKRKQNLLLELVLVASMRTAIAPIERAQLLMHSQNAIIQSDRLSRPYKGIFNCFARTIRNEGVISLWRGNTARVIGGCSMRAISFAWTSYSRSQNGHGDYGLLIVVGGFFAIKLVTYPLTYAGTRLANDVKTASKVGKWQFNGMVDVRRKTLISDGIAGLCRGFQVSLISSIMRFIAKNQLSAALKPRQLLLSLGLQNSYLAAAAVAIGFDVCTRMTFYPMATVSKRMMMTSGEAIKYKNTSDAFSQIFKKEGLKSFYNGVRAEMLWIVAAYGFSCVFFYLARSGGPIRGKKNGSGEMENSSDVSYSTLS